MSNMTLFLAVLVLAIQSATAQVIHHLPFASSGNVIELAIANNSPVAVTDVKVSLQNTPAWLHLAQKEQTIRSVGAGEEELATFLFAVDKTAPVGQEQTLSVVIGTATGESWLKQIMVAVSAPEQFALFQNYPNPFNPSTTISFDLPSEASVQLKVYDMMGREVATLVNSRLHAGHHRIQFDASSGFASGAYVYYFKAGSFSDRKRMLFVK